MDPLSVTASAISVGGLVLGSLEAVRKYLRASVEVQALNNEVADLFVVLGEVEYSLLQYSGNNNVSSHTVESLTIFVASANSKLQRLNILLQRVQKSLTASSRGIARLSWLRKGSEARQLQDDLRQLRHNIIAILVLVNS